LIVQAGVGFNHIDLEACAKAGIPVCNTPDYGTREVADHAIALMLSLIRGTSTYDMRLRTRPETWSTFALGLPPVRRLKGQVFGVVGLGRIGLAAALRAKAFELDIVFYDPYLPPGAELSLGFRRARTRDELLKQADIVSLHCPMSSETANLIDDNAIASMKDGAILINTARGGLTDLDAVERGLRTNKLAGAALDVLPKEPADRSHPLISAWETMQPWLEGRLVITPHAAFFSPESLLDMRHLSAVTVHDFVINGHLRSCVNMDMLKAAGAVRR
jgi:lactate dehydrogenase-like 2-hydroxyacid dehydrogenase